MARSSKELLHDLRIVVASEHPRTLQKYSHLDAEIRETLGLSAAPKRDTALSYFISGNWKIGYMRTDGWHSSYQPDSDVLSYGGSHAGKQYDKVFKHAEERRRFSDRMAGIYGDRFYCRGDDLSEQRWFHPTVNGWEPL